MIIGKKKQCPECCKFKCFDAFNKADSKTGKLNSTCKTCQSKYHKKLAKRKKKDDPKYRKTLESLAGLRLERKTKAIRYKGGFCIGCKVKECAAVMEFHHVMAKDHHFNWQNNFKRNLREVDKCVLLCCSCHRKVHHSYKLKYQNALEFEVEKTIKAYKTKQKIRELKKEALWRQRLDAYKSGNIAPEYEEEAKKLFSKEDLADESNHYWIAEQCNRKIEKLKNKLKETVSKKYIYEKKSRYEDGNVYSLSEYANGSMEEDF